MSRQAALLPTRLAGRRLQWCVSLPPPLSEAGARERRFFATKVQAETFIEQTRARLLNQGIATHGLSAGQREAAAAAFRLLNGEEPSVLVEIVREHLKRKNERERSVSFDELREAFLSAKSGRSTAYHRQMRSAFEKLGALSKRNLMVIEVADLERELQGSPPAARNAHLRVANAAFNFAIKKGWAFTNPVARIDFSENRRGEVQVLSNTEAAALLAAACDRDLDLLPYHLFGLFAGIRPQELERMKWEHVQLDESHILLPSSVTKTGKRRVIDIESLLADWLRWVIMEHGPKSGLVTPPTNLRKRLRAIRSAAGITTWVQDIMRHTYASNWLATNGSVDKLRANLGHRSNDVLWRHYHKAVLRKDAEQFWATSPGLALPASTGQNSTTQGA